MPVKDQFIVESKGKTFVLYAGLLDLAHERGLMAIKTTLIQIPNELNAHVAIVHAEVQTEQGTFTGLGDADSSNVSRMMVPHLIRMAETRAKARALRDAVNVGVTAFEELGEEPETGPAPTNSHAPREITRNDPRHPMHGISAAPPPLDPRDPEEIWGESEPVAGRPDHPATGAAPATPKQYQTIQRMARAAGKTFPSEGLSRKRASDIISELIGEIDSRVGAR